MRRPHSGSKNIARQRALLAALSDDLALPLLQVKSTLELLDENYSKKLFDSHAHTMALSVETGLQLVEAYRLVLQSEEFPSLELTPAAIGAILEEVAHQLTPYAQQYNTILRVDVQGKMAPVLVHQPSINAAFEVLSTSFIRAQAAQAKQKKYHLLLGAHKTSDNVIAAGVFSNMAGLSDQTLRAARSLAGHARQPHTSLPMGAASGVLIADMLCAHMWQPLRSAAHRNLHGLATVIPTSKQLQFV